MALCQRCFIKLIGFYQFTFSLLLQPCCRFEPSCSQYALDAIHKHGLIKGLWLTLTRIVRCNPWCAGGIDKVP